MKLKFIIIVHLVFLIILPSLTEGSTIIAQENENSVDIEYIAHASFKISYNGTTLLLDPYADKVWLGYNFPKNIEADAIFSTHPHYDHDGGQYIGKTPYWKDTIKVYKDPGTYNVGAINVIGIKGKHCDPYGKEFGQKNTIWKISIGDLTIAHLGDNGPLTEQNYKELGAIDILLVPIDSKYHILKKEELKVVLETIHPDTIIPMHYRIPELEIDANSPEDLGDIEPWLEGKTNVVRLPNNRYRRDITTTKKGSQIIVFKPATTVTR